MLYLYCTRFAGESQPPKQIFLLLTDSERTAIIDVENMKKSENNRKKGRSLMKLTKGEAIRRHRLMWNWIAEETFRKGKKVSKEAAFKHFGWEKESVSHRCWCCQYDCEHYGQKCYSRCIIKWPGASCVFGYEGKQGIFSKWCEEHDPKRAAELARQIANLPERKDV